MQNVGFSQIRSHIHVYGSVVLAQCAIPTEREWSTDTCTCIYVYVYVLVKQATGLHLKGDPSGVLFPRDF